MPLLFRKQHIQIVFTPLNILGKQDVDQLACVGINAISITRETATYQNLKDIGDGYYQAVIVNPEILLQDGGQFEALWKNKPFVARLLSFIWDEAHCVKTWSEFRGHYKEASRLRYLIPRSIPFFLASATLPPPVLDDVMTILQIRHDQCEIIQRSNDRPNVHITVRKIQHPLTSHTDLSFLIPENWTPDQPVPPKFVVFFDNIPDSMAATDYLRSRLPEEYWEKVRWFNADMTGDYREDEVKKMLSGDTWGLCCTDSFGMRFGQGTRDLSLSAKAVFLVESKYFDEEKQKKAAAKTKRAEKAAATAKRKAEEDLERARKVAVVGSSDADRRALPAQSPQAVNEIGRAATLSKRA
ncbi:hypothetical protein EWM64_g3363 [Hericium alpestre]|uniref:DNA 3'-5' helicase n=1 Tax=Hericium alpestre TaxID=135208 RepID=A0A4Z0A0I7_9AGAM|nr:hypothetical protein EWM64_g3363 [Hericium alpestre]